MEDVVPFGVTTKCSAGGCGRREALLRTVSKAPSKLAYVCMYVCFVCNYINNKLEGGSFSPTN